MYHKSFVGLLFIGFISCIPLGDEIPQDPRKFDPSDASMMELSSSLPYFKDFIQASFQTNIKYLLEGEGPFTIFMPNQLAFSKFRMENGIRNIDQVPEERLKKILLYHIIQGRWLVLRIPTGYYPTLAMERTTGNPIDLYINTSDLLRLNGVVTLDEPDLESTNGVIHSINTVLNIPTILSHLSVNGEFSMIYETLNQSENLIEFSTLLNQEGPYTFLAPTNEAMRIFLEEHEEWDNFKEIPSEMLTEILKYHLVAGENIVLKNILKAKEVTALNGASFTIQSEYPDWSILDAKGRKVHILLHDIQGTNGVILQVDRVLIP